MAAVVPWSKLEALIERHYPKVGPQGGRRPRRRGISRVVQVEDVDPIEAQSRQTAFERRRHGVGNAAKVARGQPHLGANDHVARLELLQDAAKVLFRLAVSVLHRGVEVVHPGGNRPRDGALLVERIATYHQSTTAPQPKPSTESCIPVRPNSRISIAV